MTNGWIPNLVKSQNLIVVVPDLSGFGETGNAFNGSDGYATTRAAFSAFAINRSIVAIHAGDIIRVNRYVRSRSDVTRVIATISENEIAPAVLHATSFDPSLGNVALLSPLISYETVALNEFYHIPVMAMVSGVLKEYDLPDLCAYLAPRSLLIISPKNQLNITADTTTVNNGYKFTTQIYRAKGGSFQIQVGDYPPLEVHQMVSSWLKTITDKA
eukprot:TRINITY_DN9682_c0_g1_i1.p1 TRINITY_DN9682_c0_g1~~TRINITY_DN9682_c0_g1_i1.p1  ORF type:complete len:215 (-),score=42.27 TRINITY_DN9682_c0_g1_i1:24-668(-)